MPQPVSIRSSATPVAVVLVRTTSWPPSGMACWALSTRLISAPWNDSRSSTTLGKSRIEIAQQLDVRLLGLGREEVEHAVDLLVQVRGLEADGADLGEVQKIVEQVLQPLAFLLHDGDLGRGAAVARRLGLGEVLGQQLHVQADRRERVLDLVRQPAGQRRDLGVLRDQLAC